MKIINKLLFVILLSGLVASCDNITDIEQPGQLPAEQALNTVDNLDAALPGLYANLDEFDNVYFNTVRTDEIAISSLGNGGQGLGGQYQFVLNSTSAMPATMWNESYSSINEINRFIVAANDEGFQREDGDEDRYNNLVGQAHAMRAFEYFRLISFFSPDLTDDSSPGVIVFTDVPGVDAQRPRNTTGETFDLILSDIEMAENMMDDSGDVTRFTQLSMTALRARIATYRKQYDLAEDLSQEVLNQVPLADPEPYFSMFRNDTEGELILKLSRVVAGPYDQQADVGTPAGSGWIGNVTSQVSVTGGVHYELERNVALLLDNPADIRRQVTLLQGTLGGAFVSLQQKYTGNVPGENQNLMNDQKLFRASEMALINAEAKVGQGDLAGAALMIQSIRSKRSLAGPASLPDYDNPQEGYADVLLERRIELVLEGHRWHDLKRIGADADVEIDRNPDPGPRPAQSSCSNYQSCEGPVPGSAIDNAPGAQGGEYYWLPLPIDEINANPALEGQQNPGYGG